MRETRDRTVIVCVMTSVLGVSVGASAVRFACHDAVTLETPIFQSRSVTATLERPEELAAESIGTVLAERDETDEVQAIGVAYQDEAQAGAVQAAMARLQIGNFQMVPEVTAALQMLEMSGELGDHSTLVFYDLGSSGLTVTVVDRDTGMVLSSARSDQISGDLVDRLICDNQLELHRFAHPRRRGIRARARRAVPRCEGTAVHQRRGVHAGRGRSSSPVAGQFRFAHRRPGRDVGAPDPGGHSPLGDASPPTPPC